MSHLIADNPLILVILVALITFLAWEVVHLWVNWRDSHRPERPTGPSPSRIDDEDGLTQWFLERKCCPDCGEEQFLEGPHGGMAVNVECAGCGHRFNLALPFFAERI